VKITTAGLLIVAALQQGFALPVRAQEQTPVMSELPLSWLSSELEESVQSADIASGKPWLALGTRTGRVSVVDAIAGEVIGLVTGQGMSEVGWAPGAASGEPPLLLVAMRTTLNAFHVKASN